MSLTVQENVILAPFTTFGIGGPADFFVRVSTTSEIIEGVMWAKEKNIPFFLLGTGANILVGDKGFRGLVIKNEARSVILNESEGSSQKQEHSSSSVQNDNSVFLTAESGATVAEVIDFTVHAGYSGFEHFAGISSSVGGALWQNLHFLSPDRSQTVFIGDIVESSEIVQIETLRHSGEEMQLTIPESNQDSGRTSFARMTVKRDYFKFGYDYSILHDTHDVVLSATFRLTPEDTTVLTKRVEANLLWRKEKHPENAARCSAGSIFKKIDGYGAGRLIEKVGLKGKQIGGAKISEKHANFIVNTGNATATDVRNLIVLVKQTVHKELGLQVETEISFIGEF